MKHSLKAIKEALASSGAEISSFLIQDARAVLQTLSVTLDGGEIPPAYSFVVRVYDRQAESADGDPEDGLHMYTFFAEDTREAQEIMDCYLDHGRQAPKDPYIRILILGEDD